MKATQTGRFDYADGIKIAEYSDGSWRYIGLGRQRGTLAKAPSWLTPWTAESSIAGNEKKWAKWRAQREYWKELLGGG